MSALIAAILLVDADAFDGDPVGLEGIEGAYPRTAHDPSVPIANFEVDGLPLSAVYSPTPMKADTLERAIADARTWPEARDVTRSASGHLVIGCNHTATGHDDATAASRAVSRLAAQFLRKPGALALFWPESGALVAADLFAGSASDAEPLPVGLIGTWVHITWYRADPDAPDGPARFAATTTGLRRFVGREIDFAPSDLKASEIAERIVFISKYLMTQGPVLESGDTLGYDEVAAFRVGLADQGYRPDIPVYQIEPA